ncbi:hypothetical protein LAZ67_4002382 [Cordylochernes scorpioides]|uniref:ATP-dependent DNA helicase n=1 Tax=Cordylochernes scorpioides TaxID=51811 RepID=A0ABY6KCP9_9ARAC|nr:hypothetical protein LAZ67_4002382 [Cordylochernes scorpioides]
MQVKRSWKTKNTSNHYIAIEDVVSVDLDVPVKKLATAGVFNIIHGQDLNILNEGDFTTKSYCLNSDIHAKRWRRKKLSYWKDHGIQGPPPSFWLGNMWEITKEFSAWLLKLGNGELTNDLGLDSDTFEIPSEMVCNGDLVKEIYGDKLLPSDFEQYTDKAILCPRNVDVDDINNRVLDILEGDSITYFSSDSIDDATPEDNESYPPVFLNSLNPSGMPLHKLKL